MHVSDVRKVCKVFLWRQNSNCSSCVPTLLYACDVKEYSSSGVIDFNTAVNDAVRKIYSFNRWESVRHLRIEQGYESIHEMFFQQRESFSRQLPLIGNSFINKLYRYMAF